MRKIALLLLFTLLTAPIMGMGPRTRRTNPFIARGEGTESKYRAEFEGSSDDSADESDSVEEILPADYDNEEFLRAKGVNTAGRASLRKMQEKQRQMVATAKLASDLDSNTTAGQCLEFADLLSRCGFSSQQRANKFNTMSTRDREQVMDYLREQGDLFNSSQEFDNRSQEFEHKLDRLLDERSETTEPVVPDVSGLGEEALSNLATHLQNDIWCKEHGITTEDERAAYLKTIDNQLTARKNLAAQPTAELPDLKQAASDSDAPAKLDPLPPTPAQPAERPESPQPLSDQDTVAPVAPVVEVPSGDSDDAEAPVTSEAQGAPDSAENSAAYYEALTAEGELPEEGPPPVEAPVIPVAPPAPAPMPFKQNQGDLSTLLAQKISERETREAQSPANGVEPQPAQAAGDSNATGEAQDIRSGSSASCYSTLAAQENRKESATPDQGQEGPSFNALQEEGQPEVQGQTDQERVKGTSANPDDLQEGGVDQSKSPNLSLLQAYHLQQAAFWGLGGIATLALVTEAIRWSLSSQALLETRIVEGMIDLAEDGELTPKKFDEIASQLISVSREDIETMRGFIQKNDIDTAIDFMNATVLENLQEQHDAQGTLSRLGRGAKIRAGQLRNLGSATIVRARNLVTSAREKARSLVTSTKRLFSRKAEGSTSVEIKP